MPNLPLPDGIQTTDLECVMADIAPLDITGEFGDDLDSDDFFWGITPELKYAQGPVAETQAHVTLLFGIHPSEGYPDNAESVLEGWEPEPILIDRVGSFEGTVEGQNYTVIVGHVVPTANLLVARRKLETLEYTDRFPTYRPHVTLAYVQNNVSEWIERMNEVYSGTVHPVTEINYGIGE